MMLCKELSEEEIKEIAAPFHTIYGFKDVEFARALFEAARVVQQIYQD